MQQGPVGQTRVEHADFSYVEIIHQQLAVMPCAACELFIRIVNDLSKAYHSPKVAHFEADLLSGVKLSVVGEFLLLPDDSSLG